MFNNLDQVKSIVFDLDGTLYKNDDLSKEIQTVIADLVASTRGVTLKEGRTLLRNSRRRLTELYGEA